MFRLLNGRLRRLCSRLRWPVRRRNKSKIAVKRLGKQAPKTPVSGDSAADPAAERPIRVATFNAAMFSMAPAAEPPETLAGAGIRSPEKKSRPRSILKQSPLHPSSAESLARRQDFARSRLRVSINLPENEISLLRSRRRSFAGDGRSGFSPAGGEGGGFGEKGRVPPERGSFRRGLTVVEVLRELGADVIALQDVRAEEERAMRPLSDLAGALGMSYVFAESWAPEYGNAILSKWPIKRWRVQKIFDDSDFRNVLKATIDVPHIGEVNFHCTHLDHLDENWRMKQIHAIINSSDGPHVLAGGLNSLDESDYSSERWTDIVKYYEETGKPTPKMEVMKFLKGKQYTDAKDFAGECESVVMIAKGQSVQGTCKYGTRVDYILTSPSSPYEFVPGSYSVFSSKGTSDHHIVKADLVKVVKHENDETIGQRRRQQQQKEKVVKIVASPNSKGIWKIHA